MNVHEEAESHLARFEVYLLTQKRVTRNTAIAYMTDLKQCALFLERTQSTFATARNSDIKAFLAYCAENDIGSRARSRKLSTIKSFYAWAFKTMGWDNPALMVPYPKHEKKLPRFLTEFQIELLLKTAQQDTSLLGIRNKIILYLLYTSGIRISELTQLRIADIDFKTEFMLIHGKGNKQRSIPLPRLMLELLQEYIRTTVPVLIPPSMPVTHSAYLFPVVYGGVVKAISRQSCWVILQDLCKRADIDRAVSPHLLRHSLATHLLQKGANLRALQLLLGHESINTVEIYTHLQTDHLRAVYDKKHPRA